jgi:hypothetical protein
MARLTWHAYYFDSFDRSAPAARMATIEAASEDEAGRIAIAQMGRSMRVHVTRPLWGGQAAAKLTSRRRNETPALATGAALRSGREAPIAAVADMVR